MSTLPLEIGSHASHGKAARCKTGADENMNSIDEILAERGRRYGEFLFHANTTQCLKNDMRAAPNWPDLSPSQKEALEMIAHKIGRILNGDPNYADSWTDIAGYARLVEKELSKS
jgi:hypothetical protein